MICTEMVQIMPYVGNHLKKPKRKAPFFAFCIFIIAIFIGIISLSFTRLFTTVGSKIATTSSRSPKSVASYPKSQVPMPSSGAKDSSDMKTTEVELQEATKPFWIHVSIEDQTLIVYDAEKQVVKSWLCSTGSPGYDTPKGTFSVYKRGESFYNPEYQEGAYYYVAFYKDFYIHSVPFDKNRNIIPAIANDLGHEDSHGCVHLSIEASKRIYDHISDGTKVVVD